MIIFTQTKLEQFRKVLLNVVPKITGSYLTYDKSRELVAVLCGFAPGKYQDAMDDLLTMPIEISIHNDYDDDETQQFFNDIFDGPLHDDVYDLLMETIHKQFIDFVPNITMPREYLWIDDNEPVPTIDDIICRSIKFNSRITKHQQADHVQFLNQTPGVEFKSYTQGQLAAHFPGLSRQLCRIFNESDRFYETCDLGVWRTASVVSNLEYWTAPEPQPVILEQIVHMAVWYQQEWHFIGSAWGDTHILTGHSEESYIAECESLCERYLDSAHAVCSHASNLHDGFAEFVQCQESKVAVTIPGKARNNLNLESLNSFLLSRMLYPMEYVRFDSKDYQTASASCPLPNLPLSQLVINLGDLNCWKEMVIDYAGLPFKTDMLVTS